MNRRTFLPLVGVLLAGAFVLPATAPAQSAGHGMAPVFHAHDGNTNNVLDRSELQTYLERRRLPASFADLWQYSTVDSNGDGGVSLEEWSSALRNELRRRAGDTE